MKYLRAFVMYSANEFLDIPCAIKNNKNIHMKNNTSVSLGNYFEDFVEDKINQGRYKNASEIIRAGLRLLEDEENKIIALKKEIQKGMDSGIAKDFNPKKHLQFLKERKKSNA